MNQSINTDSKNKQQQGTTTEAPPWSSQYKNTGGLKPVLRVPNLALRLRVSSHVADFNTRNQILIAKLLKQGHWYRKLRKTFSKFYRRHYDLVSKNTGLKQGLSEPECYGDLVYKFMKIVGRNDFSDRFKKITIRYKRIGYNMNVMRQTACLEVNPITVNYDFADLFNCMPVIGP